MPTLKNIDIVVFLFFSVNHQSSEVEVETTDADGDSFDCLVDEDCELKRAQRSDYVASSDYASSDYVDAGLVLVFIPRTVS